MLRLPEEIQVDVFLRLPAKSILICRCVCKPLCRLLYNPKFIEDHLNLNKKTPSLMLISNEPYRPPQFCPVDYASILSASASALSTKCRCDGAIRKYNGHQRGWGSAVVGSCNGLICIKGGSRFCILNPSTGEYKPSFVSYLSTTLTYGFGYDCHLDVYKLMRIVASCYSKVEVSASRGDRSWKTIRTLNRYSFVPEGLANGQFVWFLNGALHWKSFIIATRTWVIVALDMSTDRFVEYPYPEGVNPRRSYNFQQLQIYDHLGLLEDRLCLVVYDARNSNNFPSLLYHRNYCPSLLIDVWLMEDYGSWTKRYSLKPSCTIKLPRGKLVWSSSTKDGEVLLLIDGGYRKLLYDPKNNSTKVLEIPGFETGNSLLVSYVDSLVSLRSRTSDVWERESPTSCVRKGSAKKQRQK